MDASSFSPYEEFYAERVSPEELDVLLADGWRHFGANFFRSMIDIVEDEIALIFPLRVDVRRFAPSKSQRRVVRKNADARVVIEPANIAPAHEELFERHRERFRRDAPESLYTFLSERPAVVPCEAKMCCVYVAEKLVAASFFDVSARSLSSVYAMFDPDAARRGLGIFTFLCEFEHARQSGKEYVYLGYAHGEAVTGSPYAYKRQFAATEYYDWRGRWSAITEGLLL